MAGHLPRRSKTHTTVTLINLHLKRGPEVRTSNLTKSRLTLVDIGPEKGSKINLEIVQQSSQKGPKNYPKLRLGRSWEGLGGSGRDLGASWAGLGGSWQDLGPSWGSLGASWGPTWPLREPILGGGQIGTPSKKGPRGGPSWTFSVSDWLLMWSWWPMALPSRPLERGRSYLDRFRSDLAPPPGSQKSAKNVGGLLVFTISTIPQRSPSWDPPRRHFPRPGGSHGRPGGSRGGLQTAQEGSGSRL